MFVALVVDFICYVVVRSGERFLLADVVVECVFQGLR